MSARIINYVEWPAENGIIALLCCDTVSELPAVSDFPTFGTLAATSTCRVIDTDELYQLNTVGAWKLKQQATSVALDLSGYYTADQTDDAIAAALVGGGTFYDRGEVLTADAQNPIDFHSADFQKVGAWSFGVSNRPYIANLPASLPNAGATIRSVYMQRTDRFFYLLMPNSASMRCFWYAQYTGSWSSWYKVQGVEDV